MSFDDKLKTTLLVAALVAVVLYILERDPSSTTKDEPRDFHNTIIY